MNKHELADMVRMKLIEQGKIPNAGAPAEVERGRRKLEDAADDAAWNRRMSHGHEDPHIVARDRDALLEAAQELLFVIGH